MNEGYTTIEQVRQAAHPLILCHRCLTTASIDRAVCKDCEKELDELALKRLHPGYTPPGGKASLPEGGEDVYGGYPSQREVFRKWAKRFAKEGRRRRGGRETPAKGSQPEKWQ